MSRCAQAKSLACKKAASMCNLKNIMNKQISLFHNGLIWQNIAQNKFYHCDWLAQQVLTFSVAYSVT